MSDAAHVRSNVERYLRDLETIVADGSDWVRFERWRLLVARFLASSTAGPEADLFLREVPKRLQGPSFPPLGPSQLSVHLVGPWDSCRFAADRAKKHLTDLLADLARDPDIATPPAPAPPTVTREGVYFAGQQFDALARVHAILATAKTSVVIVDGYVGEPLLDLLTTKQAGVVARILTKDDKPAFVTLAKAFQKQHGGLEVRVSQAFHDRFVVVDDGDYYHFGHSLKDVGSKGFMFSRIEEPGIIAAFAQELKTAWAAAKVVL